MSVRKLLAVPLWWLAVLLVVGGGLAKVLGLVNLPYSVWLGGGLLALGLNILLGGDVVVASREKPFTARAQVSRAELSLASGLSDVRVRASRNFERLASVRAGSGVLSKLDVVDGVARLRVTSPLSWMSGVGEWRISLATNVLWDVKAHSTLGSLELDLQDVRVDRVSAKSDLGGVRVICPRRGRPSLELETTLGDLDVVLPGNVGARVRVKRGRLAGLELDDATFEQLNPNTYVTRNLDAVDTVAEIVLRVRTGEARVRQA